MNAISSTRSLHSRYSLTFAAPHVCRQLCRTMLLLGRRIEFSGDIYADLIRDAVESDSLLIQLGNGGITSSNTPSQVISLSGVVTVAAGGVSLGAFFDAVKCPSGTVVSVV